MGQDNESQRDKYEDSHDDGRCQPHHAPTVEASNSESLGSFCLIVKKAGDKITRENKKHVDAPNTPRGISRVCSQHGGNSNRPDTVERSYVSTTGSRLKSHWLLFCSAAWLHQTTPSTRSVVRSRKHRIVMPLSESAGVLCAVTAGAAASDTGLMPFSSTLEAGPVHSPCDPVLESDQHPKLSRFLEPLQKFRNFPNPSSTGQPVDLRPR